MRNDRPQTKDNRLKTFRAVYGLWSMVYGLTIVFGLSVLIITAGCAKREAPKPKEPPKAESPAPAAATDPMQHNILSFNLEGLTERGEKKWDVQGQTAKAVTQTQVHLDNIVARAYGEDAEAVITAKKGVYDKTKSSVTLEENVKATIESPQDGSSGVGISGLLGAEEKPAAAAGDKKRKTKTIITCDGDAQFDYEKNEAYFSKNVKITSEDGTIDADRITVYLDPASKKVVQIVAEGNVRLKRGENVTYSEKATYVEGEKKVALTGAPRLEIYQDEGQMKEFMGQ